MSFFCYLDICVCVCLSHSGYFQANCRIISCACLLALKNVSTIDFSLFWNWQILTMEQTVSKFKSPKWDNKTTLNRPLFLTADFLNNLKYILVWPFLLCVCVCIFLLMRFRTQTIRCCNFKGLVFVVVAIHIYIYIYNGMKSEINLW